MKSAYEWTGREKAIEFLRWLLVPCVAVLAGFVVPRLVMSFLMPPALAQPPGTPRVPPSDFQRFYLPWIANIVMGVTFVVAGARTAPRGRLVTAFVLVTLWTLFSLYFHVLIHPHRDIRYYTLFLVSTLAAAGGAAFVAYSEKRRLREASQRADGHARGISELPGNRAK